MTMLSAANRQLHNSASEMTANEMLWQNCIVETMLNLRSAANSASRKWCRITATRLSASSTTSVVASGRPKISPENRGAS